MIRIQKLLADAGLGSRRNIEEWIRDGRITVSGQVAKLGDRATAADDIRLDGRKVALVAAQDQSSEVLLYHKPVGEVTTRSDPQGRPTVFERLPEVDRGRWITVGRLDVNTSGLLLFTTDGELAHRLMHPSSEIEREYLVRLRGRPDARVIQQLLRGVDLEDGPARFDRIAEDSAGDRGDSPTGSAWQRAELSHSTYRVVLHEGRNREVRRLWNAVGFDVSRLLRVRYGPIELPRDLRPGASRKAEPGEIERLTHATTPQSAAGRSRGANPAARRARIGKPAAAVEKKVARATLTRQGALPTAFLPSDPPSGALAPSPWRGRKRRPS